MTKPHKWAKEIKAWADGAEIEFRWRHEGKWSDWEFECSPIFTVGDDYDYRIKPQPKEPQYLYVWESKTTTEFKLSDYEPHPLKEYVSNWKCIGKIKLEQDDEGQ